MKKELPFIKPLFISSYELDKLGNVILQFADDDYNKGNKTVFIEAKNDAEAITSFLNEYKDSSETLRSYIKEIERLLLWCQHIGKVNISSLRRDQLVEYQDFLKKPMPKKQWCGPKVRRLTKEGVINESWRPFVKGLSASSLSKTITILDAFFNYLVQTNYLIGNPLAVDKRKKKRNKTAKNIIDRYLEIDEIKRVLAMLDEQPINNKRDSFKIKRARYLILLLFYTGLRLAEVANHRMGHFTQREEHWFLRVTGKGKKKREIPIPDPLLAALGEFRLSVGLPSPEPKYREKTPLIPMKNLKEPISARRIDQIIRWAFNLGAASFEIEHPRKASKLRAASAHWLRHSYVTYLLDSGAPLKVAQENAGHSDISTTMHYRHVSQVDRFAATNQLNLDEDD